MSNHFAFLSNRPKRRQLSPGCDVLLLTTQTIKCGHDQVVADLTSYMGQTHREVGTQSLRSPGSMREIAGLPPSVFNTARRQPLRPSLGLVSGSCGSGPLM